MVDEHWFDALNKALVRDAPRRTVLEAAGALLASLAFAGPVAEAAKKRKKKNRKRKRRKKGKRTPRPAPPCSGGVCAAIPEWAGNQREIDHCEFICRQCDGDDPREFCIVDTFTPDGTPTKKADCCDEGRECCGGFCCRTSADSFFRCCDGKCVNITQSLNHCNGCNQPCPTGASCVDGECRCPEGQIERGGARVVGDKCPFECPGDTIPDPCPGRPPDVCVSDNSYVCCASFRCVVNGEDPENYDCCGIYPDDPTWGCRRFDEACDPDKRYPPLATHCRRGDPACAE